MDGDKSSIMVMEPPSPQCVGEFFSFNFALFCPIFLLLLFMDSSVAKSCYKVAILECSFVVLN